MKCSRMKSRPLLCPQETQNKSEKQDLAGKSQAQKHLNLSRER